MSTAAPQAAPRHSPSLGLLRSFEDSRGWCCAAYTEVAVDYNAGYTGALARLVDYFADQQPSSDCGLDLGWSHPNASAVWPVHASCLVGVGGKGAAPEAVHVGWLAPVLCARCAMQPGCQLWAVPWQHHLSRLGPGLDALLGMLTR